ncbi:MAG: acyl-CoA dehydrogenase [Bdellovibrionales bacterium]|jgi:alkylation response protein AidB-like acyl-CoA dehydrogenase|nr:acyl-CoA dehydrogenase [Bdellovibrionales bacterium]MBT3527155.1 acyl-CoA dehydrogenase [Bdellovibrionales bacterium]MBT7670385.1 acyl-CoA dehydrogenase [Bdellovibrionales bacterium]MBT7765537.1 acyl-CoA dehydrogenase [Bdellovibrionales bacterium]
MAIYQTDLEDIYFNLFELLKVDQTAAESSDLGADDIKEIIAQLDKFIGQEIYPTREAGDKEGVKLVDGKVIVPEIFKSAAKSYHENGWMGLGYPEEIEGIPVPHSVNFLAESLCNGANVSLGLYFGLTRGALNVIRAIGSDTQKSLYTNPMITGRWGGTMCLTEAGAGSDVGALTTTATKLDDGRYKMKGVKIFISSGDNDLYENIIHLVLARTPGAPAGAKGLSLFIVPKFEVDQSGELGGSNDVLCTKIEEKMGIHGSATCELTFGDNDNCIGELIGNELEGMQNMFIMMNEARLLCGIQGESQAQMAFQLTKQYVNERVQFGTEIINHPDVRKSVLKMRAMTRGMRALSLYTGDLFDRVKKSPELEGEIALLTPVCKAYLTDYGFQVAVDAIQLHGGYGFCSEYGVEQYARDLKIASIYEGTNGIQAIDFVMRKILKDGGKAFGGVALKIQQTVKKESGDRWQKECALIATVMQQGADIVRQFGEWAKGKEIDAILGGSTDFLTFCGHLVMAWRLMESAQVASIQLDAGASGEQQEFYQSKIVDFEIFCHNYLTANLGLAESILKFKDSYSSLKI